MSNLIDRATLKEAVYQEAFEKDSREARWDRGLWIRYKLFERILDSIPAMPEQEKASGLTKGRAMNGTKNVQTALIRMVSLWKTSTTARCVELK